MGKLIGFIVIIIFIVFTFLAAYHLYQNNYAIEDIKYSINLSAKALANCTYITKSNINNQSIGYLKSLNVVIDKERLLKEFYDSLYLNYYNEEVFNKIKSNLVVKIVVYHDKFYVADVNDKWSPPYFFTIQKSGNIIYFNSKNDLVYYYNATGDKVYSNISNFDIKQEQRQQVIIDKLNSIVSQHTFDQIRQKGLKIETYNPFKADGEYIAKYSRFNILDGLTFFVVFAEDKRVYLDNREFKYKNYNVVGYTMDY